jgi:hypothetical protein
MANLPPLRIPREPVLRGALTLHGVNYQTFASWIQKRRKEQGSYPALPAGSGEPLKLTLAEVELPVGTGQDPDVMLSFTVEDGLR